jgi:hypothetical protein
MADLTAISLKGAIIHPKVIAPFFFAFLRDLRDLGG